MSGMFDDFKEQVRSQANIVEIISEYVPLKSAAAVFGAAALSTEKNTVLFRNAGQELFYCYGCHVGGDVFTFVMKMEIARSQRL